MTLVLEDKIYGKAEISEPILLELISSKEIQRLKNIAQFGVPSQFYHFKGFSRYEHSLGVLLLLRKLKAPIEEQMAGLLHDVSHTAFSHVVDWVFNSEKNEDYQDKIFQKFLANSNLNKIIKKYNHDISEFSNLEKFTLLEQEIPEICADRIDYCLRDILFDKNILSFIIESIITSSGKIIFNSYKAAKLFGENYMKCQTEHWAGNQAVVRYKLFAEAIKISLKHKIIDKNDLFKDDKYVVNKMISSNIKEIDDILNLLRKDFKIIEDKDNPEINTTKKFRYINPSFLENGIIYSLLDVDEGYSKLMDKCRRRHKKGTKVRIVTS